MQKHLSQAFRISSHMLKQLETKPHCKLLLMLRLAKLKLRTIYLMLQLLLVLFNNTKVQLMATHLMQQALKELQGIAKAMLMISTSLH